MTQDRQVIGKNNNDKYLLPEAATKFGCKRTHHRETTITSFFLRVCCCLQTCNIMILAMGYIPIPNLVYGLLVSIIMYALGRILVILYLLTPN